MTTSNALRVTNLTKTFRVSLGQSLGHHRRTVLDRVNLTLAPGEVLGIVGESGSGKSTLAKCLVGLQGADEGSIHLAGQPMGIPRTPSQRQQIQMVFQDPFSALNPERRVGAVLGELCAHYGDRGAAQRARRIEEALDWVDLPPDVALAFPHELSGGQRQRVSIARALVVDPSILVADEITSALDVSVQASVLDLVRRLNQERRLSVIFISHNLAVVRQVADNILVMRGGQVVEHGTADEVLERPSNPYTQELVAAVPTMLGMGPRT